MNDIGTKQYLDVQVRYLDENNFVRLEFNRSSYYDGKLINVEIRPYRNVGVKSYQNVENVYRPVWDKDELERNGRQDGIFDSTM